MNKKEIQNIINQGWFERREKLQERARRKSGYTKKWKARQEAVERNLIPDPPRQPHYLK